MPNQIPEEIKERRYQAMNRLSISAQQDFFAKNMNAVQKVLIERRTSPEYINGYTENYIPVRIYGGNAAKHDIINVRLTDVGENFCAGIIV